MNALGSLLLWVTDHGYQVLLIGLVVVFCVREPGSRRKIVRILLVLGGLVVGAIFLAAAYGKMKPPAGFAWSWPSSVRISLAWFSMQVESYHLLSPAASSALAHFLPFFELFLGLWLISSIGLRFSSLVASFTLCGFMIAIAMAYHRGLKIDCGCGIGPPEEVGPASLFRDGLKFLLPALLVAIGAFWIHRSPVAAPLPESAPAAPEAV